MKLKCSCDRRVVVLPSGNTVHRSDGSRCSGRLTIGGNKVTKLSTDGTFVTLKRRVRARRSAPGEKLLKEIFEGDS